MRNEDLQLISTLGRALYANPAQAESRSLETVAAISTLESVSESEFLTRALGLMLHQAERDGLRTNSGAMASPFFRLSPKERFILFLLHSGRMSYRKLAGLLGAEAEEVQTLAWMARMHIASSPEIRKQAPHPSGSSNLKHDCPEFDRTRPWTQKLLDDEMGPKELSFIQNHTAVCSDCRRALSSTRELYYAVEKTIPLRIERDRAEALGNQMQKALRRTRIQAGNLPTDLKFSEAISLFLSKRENVFWIAVLAIALLALSWAKYRAGIA
jgi:hypothetical protein